MLGFFGDAAASRLSSSSGFRLPNPAPQHQVRLSSFFALLLSLSTYHFFVPLSFKATIFLCICIFWQLRLRIWVQVRLLLLCICVFCCSFSFTFGFRCASSAKPFSFLSLLILFSHWKVFVAASVGIRVQGLLHMSNPRAITV